jgi:hypothetical protein
MTTNSPFEIDSFTIPSLEKKILELYDGYINSSLEDKDYLYCMKDCLSARKDIINQNFKFSKDAVKHIERINKMLIDRTAKLLTKAGTLYDQMKALRLAGDEFLEYFIIDATMCVNKIDKESILLFDSDENNGESDYIEMSEVLDFTRDEFDYLRRFSFSEYNNRLGSDNDDDFKKDESLRQNWNFSLLGAPELRHIPYIGYATHLLFEDSNYSISDIIRIDSVRSVIKVTWMNEGENRKFNYDSIFTNQSK